MKILRLLRYTRNDAAQDAGHGVLFRRTLAKAENRYCDKGGISTCDMCC